MKIEHKVPRSAFQADPVTPEYQAEIERATSKTVAAYERARKRLEAAERRLRLAESRDGLGPRTRKVAVAAQLVEWRREELRRLEALMQQTPASVEHRGVDSFRPIPQPGRQV